MIYLEPYDLKLHKNALVLWLAKRGMKAELCRNLPSYGRVATFKGEPIAAAFLRICEGGLGMLDGLVTNPDALSELRHYAITDLVDHIVAHAKSSGIKTVLAYSIDAGTLERSKSHGFVRLPHALIGLDLGE